MRYLSHCRTQYIILFIGVGTESTLGVGARHFFSENICMKINKMPKFYMMFARK